MTRTAPLLAIAIAVAASLSTPASAQSLSVLLPLISFPDPVVVPSTKGCGNLDSVVCSLTE